MSDQRIGDIATAHRAGSSVETLFDGPGEMRAMCRAFDWGSTSLGHASSWPLSLRTTVATLLASRHPMFLWWGTELVQVFNDAYRPSFAEGGRHLRALGARGAEFWTEIWPIIGPQIDQVMNGGEATWHENQLVPIERNGRLEDVWWTYSYSPAFDDGGRVGGVLVVCQETTAQVLANREREKLLADTARAERRAARVLERVSDEHLTMDAEFRILSVNDAALGNLGMTHEDLIGRTHWEAFPASVGTDVEARYRRAMAEQRETHFEHHYVGDGYDRRLEIDVYPTDDCGLAIFWRDVSDAWRTQAALREREARLRAIYDGTYSSIGLLSPDGTLLDANRASLEFAGNTRDDLVGRKFWDTPWFTPTPGASEFVRGAVARAAKGEFVRAETELLRPSGEAVTFDMSFHPVRDEQGDVVLIVPEGRDMTEQRRAERTMRETELRYRALFSSIDDGFCVIQMIFDEAGQPVDYMFVETNAAFDKQTGFVDAVGKRVRELVPGHESKWIDAYARVARTGEPTRLHEHAVAMHRWFDAYAFRLDPTVDGRVAILFRDVTAAHIAAEERERLLHALQVERARLGYVFQQAPSFLAVLRGPEHVYDLVNAAYLRIVGDRVKIGCSVREALPELVEQGFVALLDHVLATGQPFVGKEVQIDLARTPGAAPEPRFVNFVYLPLVEADGSRTGVIAHGTDVTEQVTARHEIERLYAVEQEAREALQDALKVAEAANRAKGEFLAVMSHELRTPLNAIGGYAELMEMGIRGAVTSEQKEDLRRIQTSQRHLLGLINEVLNYAKLETGSVHYEIEAVLVHDALNSAELLVSPQARVKRHTLEVRETPRELRASADVEKLRQTLVNLLSNAVKFTDTGGHIEMWCDADDANVHIRVRDDGLGIPREKLDVIFDPFVQVRSDFTRPNEGTGLGLAISRDLARGMGGDLTVESVVGEGSTFTLTLPKAP